MNGGLNKRKWQKQRITACSCIIRLIIVLLVEFGGERVDKTKPRPARTDYADEIRNRKARINYADEIRSRKARIDYADEIKSRLSMLDVLSGYGLAPASHSAKGRIPCPLHNGKDKNFAYKPKRFQCYVCGAEGTVLDFTMQYFNIPFLDAVTKLNDDFRLGLPLGKELSDTERKKLDEQAYKRRKARREREQAREAAYERYHAAFDRWAGYDIAVTENAPETPYDELTDAYADALKKIDYAKYLVGLAGDELYRVEHGEKA